MKELRFVASLPKKREEELQDFFFFHPAQKNNISKIRGSIERFGKPVVRSIGDYSTILLEGTHNRQQTLIVLDSGHKSNILGVFIFVLELDRLILAQVASKLEENGFQLTQVVKEMVKKLSTGKLLENLEIAYLRKTINLNHF
ncbi:hypothetical protein MASR2M44_14230 [Bacteroidota bacterium]